VGEGKVHDLTPTTDCIDDNALPHENWRVSRTSANTLSVVFIFLLAYTSGVKLDSINVLESELSPYNEDSDLNPLDSDSDLDLD